MKKALFLLAVSSLMVLGGCGNETPEENQQQQQTEEHQHSFSSEYVYDEVGHWHPATCEHSDEKGNYQEHIIQTSGDGNQKFCTTCDYKVYIDIDRVLEAESALINYGKNYSVDPNAHGGGYAMSIDDCGQGMYFKYFAYVAGTKTIEVNYSTDMPDAKMSFYLNGTKSTVVTMSEKTGWFDPGHVTAKATVTVDNFKLGWNDLYLIKDDVSGSYAQIDYITIKGTNTEYDPNSFDTTLNSLKFEAETSEWHWKDSSVRPAYWENSFSMNYGLGTIDNAGDGFKITYKAPESGLYDIYLGYGHDTDINISLNGEDPINFTLNGGSTAWDDVKTCKLNQIGILKNQVFTIDITRGSDWITLDYIELRLANQQ